MNIQKNYIEKIKKYRAGKYTQGQLAKAIGYSNQQMSMIERGLHEPDTTFFVKVAELFGLPVDLFLADYYEDQDFGRAVQLAALVDRLEGTSPETVDKMITAFTSLSDNKKANQ